MTVARVVKYKLDIVTETAFIEWLQALIESIFGHTVLRFYAYCGVTFICRRLSLSSTAR